MSVEETQWSCASISIPRPMNPTSIRHGVTEEKVEAVLRRPGDDFPGSGGSRIALGQTDVGRYLQVVGRRLLLADEIRRLPADRQLLFISGREPLLTARADYRRLRGFSGRADPNPMYGELELPKRSRRDHR
jgi:Type IV secretory system Conjugative DNA transfer